ncbi:GH3 auxin-responsive promoter family protein [Chloroflexota bacterium]
MAILSELRRQGRNDEVWQMCCGYTDLTLEQFMAIQKRLLLEQLELLNNCPLGAKVMRGAKPQSVEEFRQRVPLTTYSDYCPELLEKREDILPAKPMAWIRTSGKSGEFPCKWVPMTPAFSKELCLVIYGVCNFANCQDRGKIDFPQRVRFFNTMAPPPYASGVITSMMGQVTEMELIPSMEDALRLPFEERMALGFKQALSKGFDYSIGLSVVLVTVGEKFGQSSKKPSILPLLSQPRALLRILKGVAKSKLARRPMLPRDLWSPKGIVTGGLDSMIYRDKLKELWGKYPLEMYMGSEGGVLAAQLWDFGDMSFIPNLNFLEFIPEGENFKWQLDHSYQPKTVLLDEVKAGENYELVLTNFHGGAMTRYRVGDMVRITSLRNEALGIDIPQMSFFGRADGIIDFGVTRLTEKTIWQAIQNTGIPYEDWVARKEIKEGMVLNIYIELKDGEHASDTEIAEAISKQLKQLDSSFVATHNDVGSYLDFNVEVKTLPRGSFAAYISQKRAEGAEMAHLKPAHINPSDEVLSLLQAEPSPVEIRTKGETKADSVSVK